LTIEHCPGSCHEHPSGSFDGVTSGSFLAPAHEYPSFLELTVTATDLGGLQTSQTVSIFPNVATVTVNSNPPGLSIDARGVGSTPFTRTLIKGDRMSLSAADQNVWIFPYEFDSWSDGGAQAHDITVNNNITLTANYSVRQLTVPDRVVSENGGASTANVPVVIDRVSRRPVTVHYSIGTDTAGAADVGLTSGTVTIPAGSDRAQIPVSVKADTLVEGTEAFVVNIDAPTNALVARKQARIQLLDDDGPAVFTYTSSFQAQWAQPMLIAALKLGVPLQDMPRMGAVLLRFIAAVNPGNVPALTPAPGGDWQYSTTYTTAADRDAIVADAAKFGVNGTQLHTIGAQLLTYLVLLNG
jgi:hypothetical protein